MRSAKKATGMAAVVAAGALAGCGANGSEPIACSVFKPTPDLVSAPLATGSSDEALDRHATRVEREIDAVVRCKVFDGEPVSAIRSAYGEDAADWASHPSDAPPRTLVWGTPDDLGIGIEADIDDRDRVITVRRWTLPEQ